MTIEAARRGDQAAADADRPYDSVLLDLDAGNAARAAFDLLDRCTQQNRSAFPVQRNQQPRDKGVTHHQARSARISQAIQCMTREDSNGMRERPERSQHVQQMQDIFLIHHHAAKDHEFRDRLADYFQQIL